MQEESFCLFANWDHSDKSFFEKYNENFNDQEIMDEMKALAELETIDEEEDPSTNFKF